MAQMKAEVERTAVKAEAEALELEEAQLKARKEALALRNKLIKADAKMQIYNSMQVQRNHEYNAETESKDTSTEFIPAAAAGKGSKKTKAISGAFTCQYVAKSKTRRGKPKANNFLGGCPCS